MNVDNVVIRFRDFLNSSYPVLQSIFSEEMSSFLNDWQQANWEIIVEAQLKVILRFYGEGADCNDRSNRVWMPHVMQTHRLICVKKQGEERRVFNKFVGLIDGKYGDHVPYTHILFDDYSIDIVEDYFFEIEAINAPCVTHENST